MADVLPFPLADPDPADVAAGTTLFRREAAFLKGVVAVDGLPPDDRTEVCFAGRSNVGKSTLINAVVSRRGLARASNTPGRTQEINYFTQGDSHYLVDLPGYGFAKAPVDVVARWQELMRTYLAGRASLRRAFVLIDSRHGIKQVDSEVMALLDSAAVPFQTVLTKADKIRPQARAQTLDQVRGHLQRHVAAYPELILTSAETGEGVDALRAAIAGLSPAG